MSEKRGGGIAVAVDFSPAAAAAARSELEKAVLGSVATKLFLALPVRCSPCARSKVGRVPPGVMTPQVGLPPFFLSPSKC